MESAEMTSAEQFGTWLAQAMRHAGYDIDSQRGGGRNALADKMKISKSTVTRWLSGEVLPAAEYFEPLAAALNVEVSELLIGAGIVSRGDLGAPSGPTTPEEVADSWGLRDEDRDLFFAMVEQLRKRAEPPEE